MKKFITAGILVFAFSFSASAQNQTKINDRANADLAKLETFITDLDAKQKVVFLKAFSQKQMQLDSDGMTADKKMEIGKAVEAKFKSTLTIDQFKKLSLKPFLVTELEN